MNLAMIGYRGTGKTTVARLLALRLGWTWVDTDVEVELRAAKPIVAIFAEDGEPAFRDLEAAVIEELAGREKLVLALGGGAVLRAKTREVLARSCFVVWLRASPRTLFSRLAADAAHAEQRPNLTASGGLAEIEEVLTAREPLYRACASAEIDTEGRTPDEVAQAVHEQFATMLSRDHA